MSQKLYEENNVRDIADAIREKNGTQNSYTVAQMGNAVRAIHAQSELETLTATENGNYLPSAGKDGFSSVAVDVEGGNLIDYITWEQGGINRASGSLYIEGFTDSQTRVRSVSMLPLTVGHTYEITVNSEYRVAVYCFESNAGMDISPSYAGSWQETFQFTASYPYLAIIVKKSDDSAITPSDIANAGITINDLTS